jgi:hypothetical protein
MRNSHAGQSDLRHRASRASRVAPAESVPPSNGPMLSQPPDSRTAMPRWSTRTHELVVGGLALTVRGTLIRTISLKDEWAQDVLDPTLLIDELRRSRTRLDMLTFWQRPPETQPKHAYYHERVEVAALMLSSYANWWNHQISTKTRNMARKASKHGVTIREAPFDEELVAGVHAIFNESPVRRGKPFWHYGKSVDETRRTLCDQIDRSIFIGGYFEGQLIAFFKLLVMDRYAMLTMILDKLAHRDKSPMNALMAKAVEVCVARGTPLLTYTLWRRGSHGAFQKRCGFEKLLVPRYYVPLSPVGRVALQLGLHKGIKGALPERLYSRLLALRAGWYHALLRVPRD